MRLNWAFRSTDLTRNSYCPVGALAAYDKDHFTAAFARQEATEFYCFSPKERSLEWSKRKAAKLAPSDKWYSPLPATKEWCIVHPKRLNPRGKAIVEGGGLFFLHYEHKYNPAIACLDLSGKCLSWSAPVEEHLSTMSYVIGSSLFSIGEYLGCSYIYTEQDMNFRTEVNMMLYPAQRTTPRADQIKVINTRHLEERQNIHADKERKTFTLTAENKLVEASHLKGKWRRKSLAVKLPSGSYLSGPIVTSNGYKHAIFMKPNEKITSTYFIALASITDKGETILHEPELCPTVFHSKPPAIRNFVKAGDYLVGIGLREIFAINIKTGRFGSWMHSHRLEDFAVGPDENIILCRSDCFLEVLPISLIVAQGKETDRLRQPLQ